MSNAAERMPNRVTLPPATKAAQLSLPRSAFFALVGLFLVSGGMGLVDQVCFGKYLVTIFGATAYAVSAVLAAFMAGLMLGSHLGGRLASRVRAPLLAYGAAELAAAATIALAPGAFAVLTPIYVALASRFGDSLLALSLIRGSLAALVVALPTCAMGMTLPLLSPALRAVREPTDGPGAQPPGAARLNALYAANTVGGSLGALLAAYWLLPALGLSGTLYLAASLTALVGLVALALGARFRIPRGFEATPPPEAFQSGRRPREAAPGHLHAIAALSGALVFIAEVVDTHLLAVVIGNSAYAFALILAIFLLCLFAGAALAPWMSRRFDRRALSISLIAAGLAQLALLPLWDLLPHAFAVGGAVSSFAGRQAVRGGIALTILFVPTLLMGLTFPLLLRSISTRGNVGAWVGSLTVANTLGAIGGSLLAGYVMLPALGSENSLRAIAVVGAASGAAAARSRGVASSRRLAPRPRRVAPGSGWLRPAPLAAAVALVLALALPRWDLARLTAGTNVYFDMYNPPRGVVFLREDVHGGITTVTEKEGGELTLLTNGKFQGNDGWEMHAQRYFAHYPSLFVDRFDSALLIGLGTGTTLGTYAAYPWQSIQMVEISPAIVEAARTFFGGPNRRALDDPRVRLAINDGRNFLLTDGGRYDLIGMELTSIWFAGASALYSRDFYELVSEHLSRGGIFQQWVQLHHVRDPVFATVLNTLRAEFEHVALFYGGGQGVLVSSHAPLAVDRARIERLAARAEVASVLPHGRELVSLLDDVLVTGDGIDAFIQQAADGAGSVPAALVSTDDNLRLEYDTPRGNVLPWEAREQLVARLRRLRRPERIQALLR